ncbi:hypothetical protein NECID01_1283 [Nematocida sp. AWRm77]|nr:hypothetical protein NECID01_1283 [Nematocida sp. AWRm77]
MGSKTGESSKVLKHIKERLQEIELTKTVRNIQAPVLLEVGAFTQKMREKVEHSVQRKRKRPFQDVSASLSEPTSPEESEKSHSEEEAVCPISSKHAGHQGTPKRLKCGCITHGVASKLKQPKKETDKKTL